MNLLWICGKTHTIDRHHLTTCGHTSIRLHTQSPELLRDIKVSFGPAGTIGEAQRCGFDHDTMHTGIKWTLRHPHQCHVQDVAKPLVWCHGDCTIDSALPQTFRCQLNRDVCTQSRPGRVVGSCQGFLACSHAEFKVANVHGIRHIWVEEGGCGR